MLMENPTIKALTVLAVEQAQALANLATRRAAKSRAPKVSEPKMFYILRIHPNCDLKAAKQLRDGGIPAYCPKVITTIKTGWNRRVEREVSLFPGALFIPDFAADLMRIRGLASGIGGFVRYGGVALGVSLTWMDKIRRFEQKEQAKTGNRKFSIGQNVVVTDGPWKLWEGRIERLDRNYRLRVLIDALTREIPIDLSEDQVQAV